MQIVLLLHTPLILLIWSLFFELAKGSSTADGVVEFAAELLAALDRKPVILKKSAPGFIGNRLQFALWREVLYLVEKGIADPKDIDICLMYSFLSQVYLNWNIRTL